MSPRTENRGKRPKSSPKPSIDASRTRSKILIVDDSKDELSVLSAALQTEGFSVVSASSAREGFGAALECSPDVVISDVSMPDEDGFGFLRRLRSDPRTEALPVILVSGAVVGVDDQAQAHESGADDFLTKPYSHKLLVAKLRSAIRRVYAAPIRDSVRASGLEVNLEARTVRARGLPVRLTRREFDLLTTFLRKPERVLSIPYLLETVWGYDPAIYNDPATVHSHVSSLRRKLGGGVSGGIVSVRAMGYRFTPKPTSRE